MEWNDLAPWIAITITLALSILVPLFTQIANNRHQRKMKKEEREYEQKQRKTVVYEEFLANVGAAIVHASSNVYEKAGASILQMYIYAPAEWWEDIDILADTMRTCDWGKSATIMKRLSRQISEELRKK